MSGFLLNDTEKLRFCEWLKANSKSNREMSQQLKAIGHEAMASKLNAIAMAQEIVRQDIESAEKDEIS